MDAHPDGKCLGMPAPGRVKPPKDEGGGDAMDRAVSGGGFETNRRKH